MTILKNIISTLFCLAMVALGLFIIMKIGVTISHKLTCYAQSMNITRSLIWISIINGILCDLQTQRLK